ncbi:MAG: 50S ribosomal protein L4 [Dehalococcoidia bacterium]
MKLAVLDAEGKQLRQISVDDSVFGIAPNIGVVHQAFLAQRANQRRGTASTKTRGQVQGSTAKIRRQKYTGRARAGGNRSPTRVGGGVTFGPHPRSYRQALPKKMRRLAIRSALSGKAADGQLHVIDRLGFSQPRTKEIVRILHNSGIERSVLIVTEERDRSTHVSARNLPRAKVLPAAYLNVVDLVTHRDLLLTEEAVRRIEGLWAVAKPPKPAVEEKKPVRRTRRKAEEPEADAVAEAVAEGPSAEAPVVEEKPKPRRRTAPKAQAPDVEAQVSAGEKPAPRRRRAKAAEEAPAAPDEKPADADPSGPKPRRRARKEEEA